MLLKCISNIKGAIYLITVQTNSTTVYRRFVHNDEIIQLNLKRCGCYTINASICNFSLTATCSFTTFVTNLNTKCIAIYFDHLPLYKITLTDKYYTGLPVMKGELTLCQ